MGGLLLKYWFARIYKDGRCAGNAKLNLNIRQVIFVGTPHFGAPEAIKAFAEGFQLEAESGVFGMLKSQPQPGRPSRRS